MKRLMVVSLTLLLVSTVPAGASPGDSWILPLADRLGGGWIEHPGAGYGGASAWEGVGMDIVRRAYWKMDAPTIPATTELYTIEYFIPTDGPNNWQPIESQIGGSAGEAYPMDADIPWAGAYGTNHQYIGAFSPGTPGTWHTTGPGPQTPEDASYNAGPNGIYMWLHRDSWLYAKWDYGWSIDNTVSAIRITQITPEPATLGLLAAGGLALLRRRR